MSHPFRPLIAALLLALAAGSAAGAADDAASFDLAAYKGKVVYLDFWASWCTPCRRSFPWLDALQKQHGAEGFVVVAINVDTEKAMADEFLADVPVGFRIVYDPQGKIAQQWKPLGMPYSFLIDRSGKVRSSHQGFRKGDPAKREAEIAQLLAEK